jgi:MFS family permease
VPLLSLRTSVLAVTLGAIVWGAGMGVHDSTMRAAVTDLVPRHRRGAGYGTFTAVYGLAWLAGAALIGVLYERATADVTWFVLVVQAVALALFLPIASRSFLTSDK